MAAVPPLSAPPLARVERGVLRDLGAALRTSASVERTWGALRLLHAASPPDVPEGMLLNHLVVLNLGAETEVDARFEDEPWSAHRLPHHAFSLIPAGVRHAVRRTPPEPLFVEIGAEFADGVLRAAGDGAALRPVLGSEDPVAIHILLALDQEARAAGALARVRAEALGAALVTRLASCDAPAASPESTAGLPSARLRRVLDHVAGHLDAPPSLRRLADLAGLDLYRFVREFKQSTGISPHRYVLEARIIHAKELLRDRALSITEIALRTGFATPSHFSVTFRRMTGVTPRDFRDAPAGAPAPGARDPGERRR